MINQNNTQYKGPKLGGIKLKPTVYKITGGAPNDLIPNAGYFSSSTDYGDYTNGNQGGTYPSLNTSTPTNSGKQVIYEPSRIPFVHKFGGPHCSVTGELAGGEWNTNSADWCKEEFLRVKLAKQEAYTDSNGTLISGSLSPYTCATITGVIFPYGQTNKGPVSPLGNRTSTSFFRHKFNFVRAKPSSSYDVDLYTYAPGGQNPGIYAPLYSSSIINSWGRQFRTREFQLDTDPSTVNPNYGSQGCLGSDGNIDAISFHPKVSEGDCEDFNLLGNFPQGTWSPNLGGIESWFFGMGNPNVNFMAIQTANLIWHRLQGKTDGNDLSFVCSAKRGSIIKGLIELY